MNPSKLGSTSLRLDGRPLHRRRAWLAVLTAALFAVLLGLGASPGAAQRIKMATLSPEGSPWDTILKRMGKAWEEGTDGRVSLTIYPGGVAGDEPDILRKMKIGQYQAGAISVSGLVDIDKDFTVFEVPLFYDSFPEMEAVLTALEPTLSKRLEEKGYTLLGWGYVGWVHFFTTERAESVQEMQRLKIWTWAGDEAMGNWWRNNGFKPVALAATDILTGLETGLIDAVSMPPLYAMQMQYFKKAPFMADLPLAPMMGAILISKRSFDRLSAADQKVVLRAGRAAQKDVFEQIPKLDETAIQLMKGSGLELVSVDGSEHSQGWVTAAEKFANAMRGDVVPVAIFDAAIAARSKYRSSATAADPE
jgi:TRAP-type C4-dicarboxylate transport system substrate-binding protein